MKKTLLVVILLITTLLSNGGIASGKDDFAGKQSATYFTGNYYLIGQEKIIPVCSELSLKKGTIIRSSNIAFLTYARGGNDEPLYSTLFSCENSNNIVVILDEDMQVYLSNGGYITTEFKDTEKYLKSLKTYNIEPMSVYHMSNAESVKTQITQASWNLDMAKIALERAQKRYDNILRH